MMLGATAASTEMLRVVDHRAAAPLASSSSCRGVRSVKQKTQISTRVSLSTTPAATAGREKRALVAKPPQAVQANVATIVTERNVGTDIAIDEALALARAAARAARDAARDAAVCAEAQSMTDDSEQVFPSKQDLLLLERARLTEMARSGAVELTSRADAAIDERATIHDTTIDNRATIQWKEWEFSSSSGVDLDSNPSAKMGLSSIQLEQALRELPSSEAFEQQDNVDGESEKRRRDDIIVRSTRRLERILKRERALKRTDSTAAVPTSGRLPKAKKATYDASDPVREYFKHITKTKLLTSSEEVGLAEGIQDLMHVERVKADLIVQMGREPSLAEWAEAVGTENMSLESRIKSGQACKDKMVNSNLRLVVSIAKRYQGRGMTIQDLIQEGIMGLIRGAEKFDHTRGFKFSTYAHWWIRQAVLRAIAAQSRTIRLPMQVYDMISRIKKAKSILTAEHGRTPRNEEVAELVGLNVERLHVVVKASRNPRSLDSPVGKNSDNDTLLGEIIFDRDAESPEDAINKRLLKEDVNTVLNTLSPRERDILKLRFGLVDGRLRTLEEIGNVFDVTRERVRQIEAKALRKLRQPSRNTALREYLDGHAVAHSL
ncbi:unnamed protein product [Calypogeia fissa]